MGNVKTPYDRVFIKTDEEITLPEKQALIGRLEKFLYAICTFDFDDLPIPQSRIEKFVFALISGEIPDIVPQSRAEKFLLAYLTGDTSDLPEPQSRIELLLNNLVFGIQDISNVETIQSRYELLMAYLVQHNEGSNVEPTYHTLTIKYVDVNGNELRERYVEENIKIGTIYNVSHLDDEIEIEDYQYVRTDGDKTTGVITKDREIIVVYKLKEYDLTIKYQDENGNTIHTSYIETLEKGTSYNVSHLDDEIEIEGYVYLRTDGDSLTGIMDGNKEIIVIYETFVIDTFYNLTIKYVDINGNEIFNKYKIESIKEGLNYDVSHLDNEIVIDGYKYVKTEGDSLTGIMDGNKEIIVVYEINYEINYEYVLYKFSEEIYTLYNTVELPFKSAVLKGSGDALVNISSLKGEITITPGSVQFTDSLLKNTTTYTVSFNCSSAPSTGSIEVRQIKGGGAVKMDTISIVQGHNKFVILSSSSGAERIRFKNDSASTTDFIFDNLMILEGDYMDVDIPYFEGMQSVKMPVLTTSNEYNTKSTTVTCNEDVTLRSNGDVYDELNLLTGRLTQRIDENNEVLAQEVVKTVDLSVVDQDGNDTELSTFNDITHVTLSSEGLIPETELEVATKNEENLEDSVVYTVHTLSEEFNTLYNTAEKPVKSAIFKGKGVGGLVNISSLKGEITIAPNSVQFIDSSLIKTSTIYTISFNCSSVPSTGSIEVRQVNGSTGLKMDNITVTQGYNQFIVLTHSSEVNRFRLKNDSTSETDFIFNNLMILEGDYRGVDVPYFEGINSVQMPVLAISNEDGTKSITATCNDEVELRGIGDVQDELDLLTGELIRRIDESGNILSQEITESIDISVVDQDGNDTELSTFDDITYVTLSSEGLIPEIEMEVATKNEENLEDSVVYTVHTLSEEHNTLYNTAEKPVKSAIFKGSSMVNLSTLNGEITIAPGSAQFSDSLLKNTTIYTISFNCSSVPSTGSIEVRQVVGSTAVKMENKSVVQGYNQFIILSSSSGTERIRFKNDSTSTTDFIFNDLMIREGDYTNGIPSVQIPVLTTSNEDGTKSTTVTCNEEVELRCIGDVKDELDLLTGELTRRIDENGNILSQEITESIDISVVDQDGNDTKLRSFNDITHVTLSSEGLIPEAELEVATKEDVLLIYSFENDVRGNAHGIIALNTPNEDTLGEYSIHWGDDNGALSEYEEIAFITTTTSSNLKTYEFIPLNAIPDNATRIIALHNDVISADFKIPDSKRLNVNDKLFSYGALSDMHIDGDGDDTAFSESDFMKEISYFETNGAVAICNSGDITEDGRKCDVTAVLRCINNTNLPIYTARGNHDNAQDCSGLDNELYLSIEPNGNLFLKEINGEIFIFCGIISSTVAESIFDDAQITQLSTWLETYKDRRVFLHEHVFIGETGNIHNLYKGSGLSDSNAGKFIQLMRKYRNVILCTGHSHLGFDLQRLGDHANINQRTDNLCHCVHIPSATRPRYNDIDTPDITNNTYHYYLGAQGYLIDVYRDFIILKGVDFTKDKNLPYATYILDTTPISIE